MWPSLCLRGELYVGVDAVEVDEEVVQFFTSMGPDHQEWIVGSPSECCPQTSVGSEMVCYSTSSSSAL
jgi:hypothetical protein